MTEHQGDQKARKSVLGEPTLSEGTGVDGVDADETGRHADRHHYRAYWRNFFI